MEGGEWTCPGSFKKFELRLLYLSTQERHRISPIPDSVHKLLLEIKYGLDGAGTASDSGQGHQGIDLYWSPRTCVL